MIKHIISIDRCKIDEFVSFLNTLFFYYIDEIYGKKVIRK